MLGITCLVLSFFVETIFVFGATILVKYKVRTGVCCRFMAKRRFWVILIIWTVISTSLASSTHQRGQNTSLHRKSVLLYLTGL